MIVGTNTKIMLAATIPETSSDRSVSNSASKRRVRAAPCDVKLLDSHSALKLELI